MISKEDYRYSCLKRREENIKLLNAGIKNCLCCGNKTKYGKEYSACSKCGSLTWLVGDNYPCEICGRFFLSLDVHHIDGNHKNNVIGNLIFICPFCHVRIHHWKNGDSESIKLRYYRNVLLGKEKRDLKEIVIL